MVSLAKPRFHHRLLPCSPIGLRGKAIGHREERWCAVLFGVALWRRESHRTPEACENALA